MKRTAYLWIALCAALPLAGSTGCAKRAADASSSHSASAEEFGRLTIDEVEAKMKEAKDGKLALFIYDNNPKSIYDAGHVPSARWVAFDEVKADDLPTDKEATLVFYCANEYCTACHDGAGSAVKLGYKHVYIMPAGIKGWKKAGKQVESG